MLDFRLLGTLEVLHGEDRLALPRGLPRKVLAVLLLRRGKPIRTDDLIHRLWSARPPRCAREEIYNSMSQLRKTFTREGLPSPVMKNEDGYFIERASGLLDIDRFAETTALAGKAAHRGELEDAWAGLAQALSLWNGDEPLDGLDCPALADEVSGLKQARAEAREDWCDIGVRLGQPREVLPVLRLLYKENPMREPIHRILVLAEYQVSGQAEALAVFKEIRDRMAEELGSDPDSRLTRLRGRILRRDPGLDLPAPVSGPEYGRVRAVPAQDGARQRPVVRQRGLRGPHG